LKEASIPTTRHDEEVKRGLEIGLPGASSIQDRTIPTFSRGELPHFAGINTFMKAPFVEDVRDVGGTYLRRLKMNHLRYVETFF
jgi:agmatinase